MGRKKQVRKAIYSSVTMDRSGDLLLLDVYPSVSNVGSGAWKVNLLEARINEAREIFMRDYFPHGRLRIPKKHYMASPAAFAKRMVLDMKTIPRGGNARSSLRDSVYPVILKDYLFSVTTSMKPRCVLPVKTE